MIEPNPYIGALYTAMSEQAMRDDEIAPVLREIDAQFPNVNTMHLVYVLRKKKRTIAVVVEAVEQRTRYMVYWPADVDAVVIEKKMRKDASHVHTEMKLVTEDLLVTVAVLRSIVLTEYLKPEADGKEEGEGTPA